MSKYIVKAKKAYLKSPLSTTASSVVLRNLVSSKDVNLTLADFGDWFVLVVKQGESIEMIKCDGISTSADGTATVNVATNGRALNPTTPYAGSGTGLTFNSGAEVIVTNDPLTMAQLGNLNIANTWALLQTFSVVPTTLGGDAMTSNELVRKAQLDSAVLGVLTTINVNVPATAGETISAGQLVYFDDATNYWKLCDADTAGTVDNTLLGIAQGAGTVGVAITNGVLLRGLDSNQTGMTAGVVQYASNTAGGISESAGTTEVSLGFSYNTTELYFNPRFNQQITEDQQDALGGTAGTPALGNKFITNDDSLGTGKVARMSALGMFGDGSDGAVTISANTNLTRDMYYTDLTIDATKTLYSKNYRVFVSGTLTLNGTIDNSGASGSVGANGITGGSGVKAGGVGGAGGIATPAGSLVANIAGATGGAGGDATNGGGSGAGGAGSGAGGGIVAVYARAIVIGATGIISANGGAGGTGGTGGNAGGSYGSASGVAGNTGGNGLGSSPSIGVAGVAYNSANGLGGSGGDNTTPPVSGGSGATAGTTAGALTASKTLPHSAMIAQLLVELASMTAVKGSASSVAGGGGGSGGSSTTSPFPTTAGGGGGGGYGGSGGAVVLLYGSLVNSGTISVAGGTGGAGGAGGGGTATAGTNGLAGSTGVIYSIAL